MFNVTGGELVIIFLVALVVLGPERLPEAARTAGKIMAQIREVSSGFQKELKSAMDEVGEPLQSLTRPSLTAIDGGAKPDTTDKPKSAEMASAKPGAALIEPEPEAGWATPPRPTLPQDHVAPFRSTISEIASRVRSVTISSRASASISRSKPRSQKKNSSGAVSSK